MSRRPPIHIALLLAAAAAGPRPASAGTVTQLVRGDTLTARDAHLLSASASQNFGAATELVVRDTKASSRGNAVLDFTLPAMPGRTVLQARLRLRQSVATKNKLSVIRVHPLSESFVESEATWNVRSAGVPWTTPGGTHPPVWSDRALASPATDGALLSWQVGPILAAQATGAFGVSGGGFLLRADPSPPDREVRFRSSESADTSLAPLLELTTTDEPPAVTTAWAEVQPPRAPEFLGTRFTLHLETDQSGMTPSGMPTGFDLIRIAHAGAIDVTSVDAVLVGGVPVPPGGFSLAEDAAGATLQLAQPVTQSGPVEIRFQATVLVGIAVRDFGLPVLLRRSGTGSGFQAAWPADADGIPGNGDSWFVTVFSTNTSVHVLSVSGPASVLPGSSAVPFSMRVRNSGTEAVSIDFPNLRFTRSTPGDADPDFTVIPSPSNPDSLGPGVERILDLAVDVASGAGPSTVTADGELIVIELATGVAFADLAADTTHAFTVLAGNPTVTARQAGRTVLPGETGVALLSFSIVNPGLDALNLAEVRTANATVGPGSAAERDAEFAGLSLHVDDGDGVFDRARDGVLAGSGMSSGLAGFTGLSVAIPPRDSLLFHVAVDVSRAARDGDQLDLVLPSGALVFSPPSTLDTPFPLAPAGSFLVDGMAAAQVTVHPVASRTLIPGARQELVFDATLPANGYQTDVLQRLNVQNLGSAISGPELARLDLWRDQGAPGFDASEDRLLGSMSYTGARWEITGLSEAVPLAGIRVFVTADIASTAARPATIRLAIPSGEDFGVGMASRNSGPLDSMVGNPEALLITILDRVAVTAEGIPGAAVRPGSREVVLLDFTLSNTYAAPRTFAELGATHESSGAGSTAQRDGNVRVVALHWDANRNGQLDSPAVDPLLGTGAFEAGYARFGGFEVTLAGNTSERFFLSAEISAAAADGDGVSASIRGPNDLGFVEPTALAVSWPVSSEGAFTVDGMVADQIGARTAAPLTLGPGDGPVLAFDFVLPSDGYRADALNGLRIVNLGDASMTDLSELRLWKDGGNDAFDGGSTDDLDLGALVPGSGGWQSLSMNSPLGVPGRRFFVSARVASGFTDSADVELAIPVDGVLVASGNDGPLDREVPSGRRLELSDAPLLARLSVDPTPSTTSQSATAVLLVENRGAETVRNITPSGLLQTGSGSLGSPAGPSPPSLDLAPGASGSFTWTLTGAVAGDVVLAASARGTGETSGLDRSSRSASTGTLHVYRDAVELRVSTLEFMPYSVTIGQGGIVPLNLTFLHPGTALDSDARLERLRIRLEDESGAGITPSTLLSRVAVSEGQSIFADKTSIETSGSEVLLDLGSPFQEVRVRPGDPVTLSLQLHLAPATPVTRFRVVIEDASWMSAEDAISGVPLAVVLESGAFPVRTGLANVVSEASLIEARGAATQSLRVGAGQGGIDLLSFSLENLALSGTASSVRVYSMALLFEDGAGSPLADPGALMSPLDLRVSGQSIALLDLSGTPGDSITVSFSPPLTLVQGTRVTLDLVGTAAGGDVAGSLRVRLGEGGSLDARDVNTGRTVAVSRIPSPLLGNPILVEKRADLLLLGGSAALPSLVTVGEAGLSAIDAVLEHPGTPGTARVRVDSLLLAVRDDRGVLLAPGAILDRVALVWNGQEVATSGGLSSLPAPVSLALPPSLLDPGESAPLTVRIDIDAGAPAARFQITLQGEGVRARDANLGTAVTVLARPGSTLPLTSGLAEIRSPSRELWVGLESRLPAALAADGAEIPGARLTLRNPAPEGSSSLRVRSLRVSAADDARAVIALGTGAGRVSLFRNGALWAESAALAPDSTTAWIAFPEDLIVLPGRSETLEIRIRTAVPAAVPNLRLGVDGAGVGIVQPGGAALAVAVRPEGGQEFPLWSDPGHFGARSLGESYANFPNPFAAGREETSFVYYLPVDGRVTLRVWTLRGEEIITLEDRALRGAGLHQEDRWNGRNRNGESVTNGVYVAELLVEFDDGTRERHLRKVAVVR